jgi:hypothetical protein
VHSDYLAPMAGGSDHEVICIEAKRVCDFCFQEQRIERTFPATVTVPTGTTPMVTCMIDEMNITCREVERREVDSRKNRFLVCLAITVPVRITVDTQTITQNVVFLKQAILCAPAGTDIECQVTGDCCCFFDTTTSMLNCVFNFCVVIQSKATVRVLIQTLGNCVPKHCRSVIAGCPPGEMEPCANCDDTRSSSSSSGSC